MIPNPILWNAIVNGSGVDTSDATATAEDITVGKTAYANGEKLTGTKNLVWNSGTVSNNGTEVNILPGVTCIGENAFKDFTNLASITIPDSVTSIGSYALYGCTSLTSIIIPDSVTNIRRCAFEKCTNLKTITIPNSVTSIGVGVFYDCSALTSITILSGVTSIGNEVFYRCTNLKTITIPDSVTSIGDWVFYNCTSLANIYYTGTEEQWNAITKGIGWNRNMGFNVSGGTVIHYNYTG